MSRILITGGSGFIGTNLVDYYANEGHIIINIDKQFPRNIKHQQYWKCCNILDLVKLKAAIDEFNPEYIFHLAARTDLNGASIDDYCENIVGIDNIIKAIRDLKNLKGIIFFSSRLVCEIGYLPKNMDDYKPSTLYGESKVIGEDIVKHSDITCPWDIVRPTSIWGPWFDIPYKNFFTQVKNRRYFHPKGQKIFKSFGYVGNTVYELDRIIFRSDSRRGAVFYLGDYPPLEVQQFADLIALEFGHEVTSEISTIILRLLAFGGDLAKLFGYKNPPLTNFRLNNLLTEMVYDLSPLQHIVGELPFTLAEGVHRTVAWMKSIET